MLTDEEILGLWSEGKTQKPMRPVLGSKKVIAFARNIEREAFRRAAAECRAVAVDFRRTGNQCTYAWKADSAEDCAVAVEALFWPDGEGK